MEKENNLEKIAGGLPTAIGTTLLAAFAGTPLAALLPVLTNTLAYGRHKDRVAKTLLEMNMVLDGLKDRIDDVSDSQYKLLNESILAALQTVDDEKLDYLRRVVRNTLREPEIIPHEAQLLSRIIRDISADELFFIIENHSYSWVSFDTLTEDEATKYTEDKSTKYVDKMSGEGSVVVGLINLGVITRGLNEGWMSDTGGYIFSSIVPKLLRLVENRDP